MTNHSQIKLAHNLI